MSCTAHDPKRQRRSARVHYTLKKEQVAAVANTRKDGPTKSMPIQPYPVGTHIWKNFAGEKNGFGHYAGVVTHYNAKDNNYCVLYPEDQDEEQLSLEELHQWAVPHAVCIDQSLQLAPRVLPDKDSPPVVDLWRLHGLVPPPSASATTRLQQKFVLYMSERARMFLRKLRGDVLVSACPLLRDHAWCNNYREHDRGTRFLHAHIIAQHHNTSPPLEGAERLQQLLFTICVYRLVNRTESFVQTGFATTDTWKGFLKRAHDIAASGKSYFTGAHQTCCLGVLEKNVGRNIPEYCKIVKVLWEAKDAQACIKVLQNIDGVGPFMAWQIYCDLRESKCLSLPEEAEKYCQLGPGAIDGLEIIYGGKLDSSLLLTYATALTLQFEDICQTLGIVFPYWPDKNAGLSIKEIEHALCEFSKYHRSTSGVPPAGKKRKKSGGRMRKYRPSTLDDTFACPKCINTCNVMRCITCNAPACRSCTIQQQEVLYWSCPACKRFAQWNFA